jgi:hypothetical protein
MNREEAIQKAAIVIGKSVEEMKSRCDGKSVEEIEALISFAEAWSQPAVVVERKPFQDNVRVRRRLSVVNVTNDGSWDHTGTRQGDRVWFVDDEGNEFVWDTPNRDGNFFVGCEGNFSMNEVGSDAERVFVSNVRRVG